MTITTRWAEVSDAGGIAHIHVEAWRSAYRDLLPATLLDVLNVDDRTAGWTEWITRSQADSPTDKNARVVHRMVVAEDDGEVVGWVTFGNGRDEGFEGRAEVAGLYVHPQHWRGGIGSVLLQRAERELAKAHVTEPYLWVLAGNQTAIAFYEGQGWRADGGQKLLDVGGEVAVTELRYVH